MGSIPAPEPNVSATPGVPSTPTYRASEALGKHIASDAPTSPASAVLAPSASHGSLAASPDIHELSHPDRQYTPGMTRADLAAKREAEQQRQSLLFQQRGLGKSAEPEIRTSFSDDIGRAFDTISSARSPSPAAQSPTHASTNASTNTSTNASANANANANNVSRAQVPSTPTPAGRVTTTSRLGDGKNTHTATPNNAPSRDRLSATPQSQPRSLPQRAPSSPLPPDNVTAVTLDGDTTVFFIDDGLKLPDSTPATPMLGRREGAEPDVYEEDQQNHTEQQAQQGYQGETDHTSQQDQQNVDQGSAAPRGLGIASADTPDTATANGNGAAFAPRTGSHPGHVRTSSGAGAAGLGAAAAGAAGAGAAMASTGGEQSRPSSEGLSAPSDPSRGTSTDTAPTVTASASAPGTTAFPPRDTDAEPEERQGHVGRASLGAVGGTSAFAAMQLASATQRGDARAMSTASITAIHSGMEGSSPKQLDSPASPMSPDSPSRPSPLGRLSLASGRLKSLLSPPLEAPGTPWAPSGGTPTREPGTPLLAAPGTPLVAASNAEMEQINIDTARAGDPDTETASITAIRAGREGTWPVLPSAGKSPLSPVPASSDSATDSMQDVSTGTPGTNGTRGAGSAAAAAAVAGGAAGAGLVATHGNDANASPIADNAPPTGETASTSLPTTQAPGEDHESVGHPATRGQAGTARDPAPYPPAQRDGPAEYELPHAHGEKAKHALHTDEQKVAHALHPHHGEHEHGHGHEHAAATAVAAGTVGAAGHAHGHADARTGPADVAEPRDVPESGAAAPAAQTDAPKRDDAPPAADTDLHSPTSDVSGYHTPPSTADSTALIGPAGFTPATPDAAAASASAPKDAAPAQDAAPSSAPKEAQTTAGATQTTAGATQATAGATKEAQAPAAKPAVPAGDAASASYAAKFARRPGAASGTAATTGTATTADLGAASATASGAGPSSLERPAHASHQRNASSTSSKRKGGLLSRLKGLSGKISHE